MVSHKAESTFNVFIETKAVPNKMVQTFFLKTFSEAKKQSLLKLLRALSGSPSKRTFL